VDAAKPLPPIADDQLWDLFCRAEEVGLRLEATSDGITWEVLPGLRHQLITAAILQSIEPSNAVVKCECSKVFDLAIRFPSGVAKRPDIAIFCCLPLEEEGFVRMVPEAVIEITSPGYEDKDLISGPPLYLANGVKDVFVLDRRTGEVHRWNQSGHTVNLSPTTFTLLTGCRLTV
jgi:Uma2 family endonuclease